MKIMKLQCIVIVIAIAVFIFFGSFTSTDHENPRDHRTDIRGETEDVGPTRDAKHPTELVGLFPHTEETNHGHSLPAATNSPNDVKISPTTVRDGMSQPLIFLHDRGTKGNLLRRGLAEPRSGHSDLGTITTRDTALGVNVDNHKNIQENPTVLVHGLEMPAGEGSKNSGNTMAKAGRKLLEANNDLQKEEEPKSDDIFFNGSSFDVTVDTDAAFRDPVPKAVVNDAGDDPKKGQDSGVNMVRLIIDVFDVDGEMFAKVKYNESAAEGNSRGAAGVRDLVSVMRKLSRRGESEGLSGRDKESEVVEALGNGENATTLPYNSGAISEDLEAQAQMDKENVYILLSVWAILFLGIFFVARCKFFGSKKMEQKKWTQEDDYTKIEETEV